MPSGKVLSRLLLFATPTRHFNPASYSSRLHNLAAAALRRYPRPPLTFLWPLVTTQQLHPPQQYPP